MLMVEWDSNKVLVFVILYFGWFVYYKKFYKFILVRDWCLIGGFSVDNLNFIKLFLFLRCINEYYV